LTHLDACSIASRVSASRSSRLVSSTAIPDQLYQLA
jgi:hypothetical protein